MECDVLVVLIKSEYDFKSHKNTEQNCLFLNTNKHIHIPTHKHKPNHNMFPSTLPHLSNASQNIDHGKWAF